MVTPLVSVIIPVYNVENYLEESLKSIVSQTYNAIEVIIVNDGSTDNSKVILDKYAQNYSNIKIINQKNEGLSGARNSGLPNVTGKYIYFFDSDDMLDISAIENLVNFSEKNELDIVRFNAEIFYDENFPQTKINTNNYYSDSLADGKIYTRNEFLQVQQSVPSSVCIYFFKRSVIIDNNLKFWPKILHEDELFLPLTLYFANRIGYLKSPYFKRRYRLGSIMTSTINRFNDKKIKLHAQSYFIVVSELKKFQEQNKMDEGFNKYLHSTIQRIGQMIFGSSGLSVRQNLYLIFIGINPIAAFFKKFYLKINN